jgi:hypothetical protein
MPRYATETVIFLLLALWLMGWLVTPFGGNLIHLLLVLVLAVVVLRVLQNQGRRTVP